MSRHPIFVIEGPDGVGKTTLSDRLCKLIGAKYVHLTYRWKDRMHLYHGAALSYALKVAERHPVVIDRWWPSEKVYADTYRGGTTWPFLGRAMERVAQAHGVTYLFCIPRDRANYLRHYNELKGRRVEMYDSGMERVYDAFMSLYHQKMIARPNTWLYDFFEQGSRLDEVVQALVELSSDERALLPNYSQDSNFTNLSGNVAHASYLLVGDRPVEGKRGIYPFAGLDGYSVSMSEGLDMAGVAEHRLAYINANFPSAQELTYHVIHECNNRKMRLVALGDSAAKTLTNMGMQHMQLPHPREGWDADTYSDIGRILR